MSDQKPPFYGDPNMLAYLPEETKSHVRAGAQRSGCLFLCQLVNLTEEEFSNTHGIGETTLRETKNWLTNIGYSFRNPNSPRMRLTKDDAIENKFDANYICSFPWHMGQNSRSVHAPETHKQVAELKKYLAQLFDLPSDTSSTLNNKILTKKPLYGFAADDFEITETGNDCEGVHFSIRLKDIKKHETWNNLCADRYVTLRSNPDEADLEDEQTFLQRTFADAVVYSSDCKDITLHYDEDSSSLAKLATINVLECFADAVNDIIPRAQQRALDGFEKRYGIKQPKNG